MDIHPKYKSAFGYQTGGGGVDSYGVDHSNFSLRDEIKYQTDRVNKENQLQNYYNNQGITKNYPQYGSDFWSAANSVGGNQLNNVRYSANNKFKQVNNVGYSNNPINQTSGYFQNYPINFHSYPRRKDVLIQQRRNNVENNLLMDGMDVIYGMNRTINGMTFGGLDWLGNKLSFDSQMNEYLNLKDARSRDLAKMAGNVAEIGGAYSTGKVLNNVAKYGYNQANMAYNGYKIGKKYDSLLENPFQGSGSDVIVRMRNHNGEPVVLQRGEAIRGQNSEVVASGNSLKRVTGTKSNYGLDKGIYKHGVSRIDAQRIPRIIQQKPVKTNAFGQNEYIGQSKNGPFRVVTSPKDGENIISTMYYITK